MMIMMMMMMLLLPLLLLMMMMIKNFWRRRHAVIKTIGCARVRSRAIHEEIPCDSRRNPVRFHPKADPPRA